MSISSLDGNCSLKGEKSFSFSQKLRPSVVVYRNHLLPHSETFIYMQVSSMEVFDYCYVGLRRVRGLILPDEKVITVYGISQKINELIYKIFGISPELCKQVQQLSPQIIHAHFGPDAIRAIPLSNKLGIPLVVTFHGYDVTVKPSYAWHSSYTQFIYLLKKAKLKREAAHFIAVSDYIKNLLIDQGFSKNKISTHYVGVDTSVFTPEEDQIRNPTVLFVGRLVEVKGCEYLIRAIAKVQNILPDAELVIIGDGPLRSSLEKLARETIGGHQFLGFQPSTIIRQWMNKAKVFCVPSTSARSGHTEAFGIVFAEAQSMGLPVVSFNSGGISEAVEHAVTGFLAPEKDEKALAEYLIRVLDDPILWHSLSENAMKRVRQKFDLKHQTKELEKLYLEIIAEHRSHA
jgi:colanic acid/amylovoran biosynthesis glycosyltransferase